MTFSQERTLINRETANGMYKLSSYYGAKMISDLPFQILPTVLFTIVFYFMAGLLGTAKAFFEFLVACLFVTFAQFGLGYLVAASTPAMAVGVLVAPLVNTIFAVLAGFFVRDPDIPAWIAWFRHINPIRWGFFSTMLSQFPSGGSFGFLTNEVALEICGIVTKDLWLCIGLNIILGVVMRVVGFLCLKFLWRNVGVEC
eukprot:Polyplicarium_translucidae@DN1708_c0_g1_i1.p3